MDGQQAGLHPQRIKIKATCLRLLAAREHSQKELVTKLLAKGWAKDDILAVIEELAQQGWQCDLRYAESYARSRINKGYGPLMLAYELRQKGVGDVNLDDLVRTIAGSWQNLLEQVYSKKFGRDACLDRQEWAKRSRFLLQRGFTGTMVSALFNHLNIKF
ncbi:MAG: regulatory protein RecX [Methylococcales bacterium]|nr:regulatory protein RecX [Methylococcales bacterium]